MLSLMYCLGGVFICPQKGFWYISRNGVRLAKGKRRSLWTDVGLSWWCGRASAWFLPRRASPNSENSTTK